MSQASSWMKYVGMPYRMGADPRNGNGTDCIRLVLRVLEDAGLQPPPVERQWYKWLAEDNLDAIRDDWYALTEQTAGPEQYAMALVPTGGVFCIAVVVDDGLLTVSANLDMVAWVPLHSIRPLNYRRLRNA
jgi:hypothetical protein